MYVSEETLLLGLGVLDSWYLVRVEWGTGGALSGVAGKALQQDEGYTTASSLSQSRAPSAKFVSFLL